MRRQHKHGSLILSLALLALLAPPESSSAAGGDNKAGIDIGHMPFRVAQFSRATNDIVAQFVGEGIPVDTTEIVAKKARYFLLRAYPYSGVDTTDIYCFVWRNSEWSMYLRAFLPATPRREDVSLRERGEFVDVLSKGKLVLSLTAP